MGFRNKSLQVLMFCSFLPVMACRTAGNGGSYEKITNGILVKRPEAVSASTVLVLMGDSSSCTGTLLKDGTILTAAHCLKDASDVTVVFFQGVKAPSEVVKVVGRKVVHEDFDPGRGLEYSKNDIGLVQIDPDLVPPGTKPVRIGNVDEFEVGDKVIIAGYGVTSADPKADWKGELYKVETVVSELLPKFNLIVYKSANKISSACHGDSGGPMFINKPDEGLVVIGITRGPVITDEKSLNCVGTGTYTNATLYQKWISSHSGSL